VAGRPFEVLKQDSQVNPRVGVQVTRKFIQQDHVDFIIGPVASHVAIAMSKAAIDSETFMIIANAGADQLTRELCSPYIFRTSFSNWQPNWPMGQWMAKKEGIRKVALLAPNYAAGKDMMEAFKEGFLPAGGEVTSEQYPALGESDFQPYLSAITQGSPQAVFVFFSGADAVKFVQQYAQAGLNRTLPLYSAGFLVENDVLPAQGDAALGIKNSLHWADTLDNPTNKRFLGAYEKRFGVKPSTFAMQGYDTGQLLIAALKATGGDTQDKARMRRALETARIESPRGPFRLSAAHNPIQNIYVRQVVKGPNGPQNRVIDIAWENLEDPGTGCTMKP
jgi:branched-chain amino acid transport system substrate-binding protein